VDASEDNFALSSLDIFGSLSSFEIKLSNALSLTDLLLIGLSEALVRLPQVPSKRLSHLVVVRE